MKIHISDISSLCFPEDVNISIDDSEMRENIKARVRENIGAAKKSPRSRTLRTVLLAAAAAAILTTAAFAVSRFSLTAEMTEDAVSGHWTEIDENGNILNDQKIVFPDAGMVLSFEGPPEQYNIPQFRCFWLPSEPDVGITDSEGWTGHLADWGEGISYPYEITVSTVNTGNMRYVLNGDVEIISEEHISNWYILKLTSDYTGTGFAYENNRANYIIMFDEVRGYLLEIGGTLDMAVLEHIANEIEITAGSETRPETAAVSTENIGCIDVGRG